MAASASASSRRFAAPGRKEPDTMIEFLPLSGLRVLELADGVAGPYAGKLLGDLGAEVIKVEPPDGDSARQLGPFPGGVPDHERSGMYVYLNSNKRLNSNKLQLGSDRSHLHALPRVTWSRNHQGGIGRARRPIEPRSELA